MSIKGTRERKREGRTGDGDNPYSRGEARVIQSLTQRNIQGSLFIIIVNVDRGSFYTHQLARED